MISGSWVTIGAPAVREGAPMSEARVRLTQGSSERKTSEANDCKHRMLPFRRGFHSLAVPGVIRGVKLMTSFVMVTAFGLCKPCLSRMYVGSGARRVCFLSLALVLACSSCAYFRPTDAPEKPAGNPGWDPLEGAYEGWDG